MSHYITQKTRNVTCRIIVVRVRLLARAQLDTKLFINEFSRFSRRPQIANTSNEKRTVINLKRNILFINSITTNSVE